MKIEGLHLWGVDIRHDGYHKNRLWITTETQSLRKAAAKAEAFLKNSNYGNPEIIRVRHNGTLDA